ncbi:MAG: hypothetical protein ACU0DI_00445 [Paracoccaceae bacterium]
MARTIQAFSKKSGKERDGYEYVTHLVTRRTAKLENALPASLMELALPTVRAIHNTRNIHA